MELRPDDPRKPKNPVALTRHSWGGAIRRTFSEFREDDCTDWAAALTYYGTLSLFPAMLALLSLVSLVGDPEVTTQALLNIVGDVGPQSAVDTFAGPIRQLAQAGPSSGLLFVTGLLGALWAASGYVGAFGRAMNAIYEVEEGRPFWKLRPLQVALTLTCVVFAALVVMGLVVTGPLAQAVGDSFGWGSAALTFWNVGKWPLMLIVVGAILTILFYATPNVRQPRWVWLSPGTVFALVVWAAASAAFAVYVGNFGSYNATFGSLGAVVVFLVWLWLTNCAILLGGELNAELERGRELQAGMSEAKSSIRLPPRTPHKNAS
jgi:membrane protein